MRGQQPAGARQVDADGVVRIEQGRSGVGARLLGLALLFTVACLALSAWLMTASGPVSAPPAEAPAPRASAPVATPRTTAPRPSRPPVAATVAAVASPVEEDVPEEDDAAPSEEPMEEKTGLQLFVPGTKPIKKGIVVPEGFELPPGYLRHYQTTDSGKMLKPILLFHPDYKPLDAQGQPVPLPESRVVPEDMAPPGMPIQMLDVPENTVSDTPTEPTEPTEPME
ncbi:hypothetical protein P2318_14450 [Myxococcaceae bacterium GXIMD 01537]